MNGAVSSNSDFYVVGGALHPDAPSYVEREADHELFERTKAGDFCYVLSSRQVGKSSLMSRTAQRLCAASVRTAVIDLTGIGTVSDGKSADQWYYGLVRRIARELSIDVDASVWWREREGLLALQRLTEFFEDIVLARIPERVVLFLDEIDTTISLPFKDDFFAAIRACYNARATRPEYARLSFVLLGVISPSDLIADTRRTPFNIGHRIDLTDFTAEEASPLACHLGAQPGEQRDALARILYWTGGHPYLTQKVCSLCSPAGMASTTGPARTASTISPVGTAVGSSGRKPWEPGVSQPLSPVGAADLCPPNPSGIPDSAADSPASRIDRAVSESLLDQGARRDDSNLRFVSDRLAGDPRYARPILKLYRRIRRGQAVADQPLSPVHTALKLSGVVKVADDGVLRVRNRIYETVFTAPWAKRMTPANRPARWTAASSLVLLLTAGVLAYRAFFVPPQLAPALTLDLGGGVKMDLVAIPPGEFLMGSPEGEEGRCDNEGPQHPVRISRPFYMGKYEVTQAQWRAVVGDNPAVFKGDDLPVEQVSWDMCKAFCAALAKRTGYDVRLPTEAEWEYACRAGTQTRFSFGDRDQDLDGFAWHGSTSHSVGTKEPNAFGLYDMHGNVWEWCEDAYHDNYDGTPTDGSAWTGGGNQSLCVLRGGSWSDGPGLSRCAYRGRHSRVGCWPGSGFRVVVAGFGAGVGTP